MPTLTIMQVTRRILFARHTRSLVVSLFALFAMGTAAHAGEGPFVGVDLGVSKPVNGNYHSHVETGAIPGAMHYDVQDQPDAMASLIEQHAAPGSK